MKAENLKILANILTGARIVLSFALLFFAPLSVGFYILYFSSGATDMADGTFARLSGKADETGAKLDTAADIIFFACAVISLFPVLHFPLWIWLWCAGVAVLRIIGYAFCKTDKHTVINKLTGISVFLLPLYINAGYAALCLVSATVGAIYDLRGMKGKYNI